MVPIPGVAKASVDAGVRPELGIDGDRRRQLHVGRIRARGRPRDRVLAGRARGHELVRAHAAHHPDVRFDHVPLEPAAVEDARVGLGMRLVGARQPALVGVERVRVLHGELADPQDAALGPRLVAQLGLELIPALRQVAIRADLPCSVPGDDLLVGHAKHHRAPAAILETELFVEPVPPGRLPDLGGMHDRQLELLGADRVHFLADDLRDPLQRTQPERQEAVEAGRELAHEPGPDHQLVADRLGIRRRVTQGRPEAARQPHRSAARSGGHPPGVCGVVAHDAGTLPCAGRRHRARPRRPPDRPAGSAPRRRTRPSR